MLRLIEKLPLPLQVYMCRPNIDIFAATLLGLCIHIVSGGVFAYFWTVTKDDPAVLLTRELQSTQDYLKVLEQQLNDFDASSWEDVVRLMQAHDLTAVSVAPGRDDEGNQILQIHYSGAYLKWVQFRQALLNEAVYTLEEEVKPNPKSRQLDIFARFEFK